MSHLWGDRGSFPSLQRTQWDDGMGIFPGRWIKSPKAFVIHLYSLSRGGQRHLGFLKHLYLCIAWNKYNYLKAEEVPLWNWKGKIYPYTHGFYCPPNCSQKQSHLWVFQVQKQDYSKRALCSITISPTQGIWECAIQKIWERGKEMLPLRPLPVLVIEVVGDSWEERLKGRYKDRRIEGLQGKRRGNEKKENDRN